MSNRAQFLTGYWTFGRFRTKIPRRRSREPGITALVNIRVLL